MTIELLVVKCKVLLENKQVKNGVVLKGHQGIYMACGTHPLDVLLSAYPGFIAVLSGQSSRACLKKHSPCAFRALTVQLKPLRLIR